MPATADTNPTSSAGRHAVAARFLTPPAGDERADELLELRCRLQDGYRMGQLLARPSGVRALATHALALGRWTDVYAGCAPRTRRHGGRDAESVPSSRGSTATEKTPSPVLSGSSRRRRS